MWFILFYEGEIKLNKVDHQSSLFSLFIFSILPQHATKLGNINQIANNFNRWLADLNIPMNSHCCPMFIEYDNSHYLVMFPKIKGPRRDELGIDLLFAILLHKMAAP